MQRLLTAKDLQYIFGCGKNRAYELIHAHGFPTINIRGKYYVREEDLNVWMTRYAGKSFAV